MRIINQINESLVDLEEVVGSGGKPLTLWNPNIIYQKGDLVLYFKQEREQKHPDVEKREFAFILLNMEKDNKSIPNYSIVDMVPDFSNTGWRLINPMSYLLQDMIGMKAVVEEVFKNLIEWHEREDHGLVQFKDIGKNLLKKDYSNLQTTWQIGQHSLVMDVESGENGNVLKKLSSNGIMEYSIKYSFNQRANNWLTIDDKRQYRQKSPIWDESDHTIFSQKFTEDDLFSVVAQSGSSFNNLRYGTNVFNARIDFPQPFINDEYMVFFDTYEPGQFVFGYGVSDLQEQDEPTWDAVVSLPMMMDKSSSGFSVVLPIHCHFNSIQKYNIGVPWNNEFRLQVIGRYR